MAPPISVHRPGRARATWRWCAAGQAALWWAGVFLVLTTLVWRGSELGWGEVAGAMLAGRTVLAWRAALVTLGVLLLIVAACIELAPYYHVLGTDKVGQDVLYLALKACARRW